MVTYPLSSPFLSIFNETSRSEYNGPIDSKNVVISFGPAGEGQTHQGCALAGPVQPVFTSLYGPKLLKQAGLQAVTNPIRLLDLNQFSVHKSGGGQVVA